MVFSRGRHWAGHAAAAALLDRNSVAVSTPALQSRIASLRACLEVRDGCSEWEVEWEGHTARAVAFTALTGPLRPGDRVLLNTTAVALSLGTGGVHFVMARLGEAETEAAFPGREAGHILKLRYTPLQHRVLCVEEDASPHREALLACRSLDGMPVLAAELHSQGAAAAIAARATAPKRRIALVLVDSASLPASFSRLAARLRGDGVVDAVVTTGQAFGGDYEAVNVYSGLLAARAVAQADLAVVTQGPGNVGTGTPFGFSGMALAEALHAAAALGGTPILVPRMSEGDPRERHRGLSHHTRSLLAALHVPVSVPHPTAAAEFSTLAAEFPRHRFLPCDPEPLLAALEPYRKLLTTMGRTLDQDALFFRAAAAAGGWAAGPDLSAG